MQIIPQVITDLLIDMLHNYLSYFQCRYVEFWTDPLSTMPLIESHLDIWLVEEHGVSKVVPCGKLHLNPHQINCDLCSKDLEVVYGSYNHSNRNQPVCSIFINGMTWIIFKYSTKNVITSMCFYQLSLFWPNIKISCNNMSTLILTTLFDYFWHR